jgi:hypothetical protein
MPRIFIPLLSACLALCLGTAGAAADGDPSKGAKGMPGAIGTFSFKPTDWKKDQTTWWKDTDGVKPGEAGCHIGTDETGKPNGRMFGEACLSDVLLVESNPGADAVHKHTDDTGHPDKFDCNAWCVGKGSSKGVCTPAPAPPCEKSAKCVCE